MINSFNITYSDFLSILIFLSNAPWEYTMGVGEGGK